MSNLVRSLERKIYATEELLGEALIWHDENNKDKLNNLCKKK